jgi:hypothetical protein
MALAWLCLLTSYTTAADSKACQSQRPAADGFYDPYPEAHAIFGQREGTPRTLVDGADATNNICDEYRQNLNKSSSEALERHAAWVFIDNVNCTVTKVRRKFHGVRGTATEVISDSFIEGHWSSVFSGLPHFTTLLVSHDLPDCEVLVFANEADDSQKRNWGLAWSVYKAQLDEMATTIEEHHAIPVDLSNNQLLLFGSNLTLIDYEQWRRAEPDPRLTKIGPQATPGRQTSGMVRYWKDAMFKSSALHQLEVTTWLEWILGGRHYAKDFGLAHATGLQLVASFAAVTRKVKFEYEFRAFVQSPLQFESISSGANRRGHCTLRRHLFRWIAHQQSPAFGAVGVQQESSDLPVMLGTPQYLANSLYEVFEIMKGQLHPAPPPLTPTTTPRDKRGDLESILKLDVAVLQIIVSDTEPADKWAGSMLQQLAELELSTKPAVVVVFVWNAPTSAFDDDSVARLVVADVWPQPTWSAWHQEQLVLAQQYHSKGLLDVSILGTWFHDRPASWSGGSWAAVNVHTTDRKVQEEARRRTDDVLAMHFLGQLLSPAPPEDPYSTAPGC